MCPGSNSQYCRPPVISWMGPSVVATTADSQLTHCFNFSHWCGGGSGTDGGSISGHFVKQEQWESFPPSSPLPSCPLPSPLSPPLSLEVGPKYS